MKNIKFACFSPHPPLLLPSVGSKKQRAKVSNTIQNLKKLGKTLKKKNPNSIIISSPHPDWGFNVPLHFLAPNFEKEIKTYLLGSKSPQFYFDKGKEIAKEIKNQEYALIGSGDLSHCLKKESPYGFHEDGPRFDKVLIKNIKEKNIDKILKLNEKFPKAAVCGLQSFSFILGILENKEINYQPEILSYEGPFGVGYLVVNFKIQNE